MNILSIDFDIIMAPDISLYNPLIRTGDSDKSLTFEKLSKDFPLLQGCRADLNHYHKIFAYLLNNISHLKKEDIRISFSHEDIKYLLQDCQEAHVYNIDHHHDLGYPQPEDNVEENICSCANWGEYYFNKGIITELTWLKNTNSEEHPNYKNDLRVKSFNLSDFDLNTLPTMDKLFICLSPEWTSPMYYPLFYVLLDLINHQIGCHLEVY